MRRPERIAVAHTVASHASANPKAATLKNITTSATIGIPTTLVSAVYVFANAIDAYWYKPVSTGYSMYRTAGRPSYWVRGLPLESVSSQLDLYGNFPRFNISAVYSGTVSE